MNPAIFAKVTSDFLFGFSTLFSIMNPIGIAFVFLERTATLTDRERRALALRVALYSMATLLVSLFVGSAILGFFGISLTALRIAGGLVVAFAGWTMLNSPIESARPQEAVRAGRAGGGRRARVLPADHAPYHRARHHRSGR